MWWKSKDSKVTYIASVVTLQKEILNTFILFWVWRNSMREKKCERTVWMDSNVSCGELCDLISCYSWSTWNNRSKQITGKRRNFNFFLETVIHNTHYYHHQLWFWYKLLVKMQSMIKISDILLTHFVFRIFKRLYGECMFYVKNMSCLVSIESL